MPHGQTFEDLSDSSVLLSTSPSQTSIQNSPSFYVGPSSLTTYQRQAALSLESYSTTTVTVDCQTTLTLTSMPSYYITAAPSPACTGTSASCPCASNYECLELSPCLWGCEVMPMTSARPSSLQPSGHPTSRSTRILTSTQTVVPMRPSSSAQPPAGIGSHPPYAGADVDSYLPCVSGTFICLDKSTWDTCDYNANAELVYGYPRQVAAGMECITFLSPYSGGTSQQGQQGLTPKSFYRDDRVVRARPDGDCSQDGAIKCTSSQTFEVCDQGGWVDMGSVPAGQQCENGNIV